MSRIESSEVATVRVGVLGKAHGLKGAMFVVRDDGDTYWPDYPSVELGGGRGMRAVTRHYLSGGRLVIELEGVRSREEAERLVGVEVRVVASAIEVDEDEVLVRDLIGCAVFNEHGAKLGSVVAVHAFGAQDNLEIRTESGGHAFLPFIDDFVEAVDAAAKRIDVHGVDAFIGGDEGGG